MVNRSKIVILLGGSLLYTRNGISTNFLSALNKFIRTQLKKNNDLQFFLVVGGGIISAQYRNSGKKILRHKPAHEDIDWIGIHVTRLNAHLIKTIFKDLAHPYMLKNYDIIRRIDEPVAVGAGWRPGISTDFCAVTICEDYSVKKIINLMSVNSIYDKDPKKYKNAHPLGNLSWNNYQKIVGKTWVPDVHLPFDPMAAKKAKELKLTVVSVHGNDFKNLERYFNGKEFVGTVIEN